MGGTRVDVQTVQRGLRQSAAAIKENRDYLTQLDAAIGDADHGTNMDRGFSAVLAQLDGPDPPTSPGKALTAAGSTLVSKVGGASGPLWGTALRRAGRSLGETAEIGDAELVAAVEAAVAGVRELGGAAPGDATMIDALQPAVEVLQDARRDGLWL